MTDERDIKINGFDRRNELEQPRCCSPDISRELFDRYVRLNYEIFDPLVTFLFLHVRRTLQDTPAFRTRRTRW